MSGPWLYFAHIINRAFASRFRNPLCLPLAGSAIMERNVTAETADMQGCLRRAMARKCLYAAVVRIFSAEIDDLAVVATACDR